MLAALAHQIARAADREQHAILGRPVEKTGARLGPLYLIGLRAG
jgi:hypothetical protein